MNLKDLSNQCQKGGFADSIFSNYLDDFKLKGLKAEDVFIKDLGGSFRDVDVKKGIVSGYFSHFGSVDSDNDVIQKGAYAKSLQEGLSRIKHLLDHNTRGVIGLFLKLLEDSIGLYYESKIGIHNLGVDFLKMVDSGLITEHSVGFIPIKQSQEGNINVIREARLIEGSSLQFLGANPNTPLLEVKSENELQSQFDLLNKALKSGNFSDETFTEIILPKFKSIETTLADLKKSLKPSNSEIEQVLTNYSFLN